MKTLQATDDPVNVIVSKDRQRGFFVAIFDSRQINPRVTIGSTWTAYDKRYDRKYLVRVVDLGYNEDYDLKQILAIVRQNPDQPFDPRALEYYCSEKAWLRLEGEFATGGLRSAHDQPTVLQTFLKPTTAEDNSIIAAPDINRGFVVGNLRSGVQDLKPPVTLEDRFVGHRTLVTGASGFGKSTLVRNIARYWLETTRYGKLIDDLKGEYISDVKNESGDTVAGLYHHPSAPNRLYLFSSRPQRFEGMGLEKRIGGVIPLRFSISDIPPDSLKDIATHLTEPQRTFLDMYQDRADLFQLLLRRTQDGSPDTSDWHKLFQGWIVFTKEAKPKAQVDDFRPLPSDFLPSSYTPIHGVIKQLRRLESRPYMSSEDSSCLPQLRALLKSGATILLDKSGLTEDDRVIISTVIANNLYKHNENFSSGNQSVQKEVVPFVYLVEEAHLLLSNERAKEGSVFVNFAKTGRSFLIGLVAVTQRPSGVDANILSQFDNYVTFRLTNEQDVKDLIQAQTMFQGYEGDIRTMNRGAAVTAFGEPTKVQSIKVFEWTKERASTPLKEEQSALMQAQAHEHRVNSNRS